MIRPDQIPPEVVEAAAKAIGWYPGWVVRKAIAAALSAWPGMVNGHTWQTRRREIILPLPAGDGQ